MKFVSQAKQKPQWRSIDIDLDKFSAAIKEGFISLEELTDYTLVKEDKHSTPGLDFYHSADGKKKRIKSGNKNHTTNVDKPSAEKHKQDKVSPEEGQKLHNHAKRKASDLVDVDAAVLPKKRRKRSGRKRQKHPKGEGKTVLDTPPVSSDDTHEEMFLSSPLLRDVAETTQMNFDADLMSAWNGLFVPDCVLKALFDQNFTKPTQIQELTLPAAIKGKRDIVGAAETGSGKTLAFGIPIIDGILKDKHREGKVGTASKVDAILRALIVTPTRELAIQIKNHLNAVVKYADIKVAVLVGGMSIEKQERILKSKPDVIIATPGRLWELIDSQNMYLANIDKIRYLVIDETDRMVEKGHFEELEKLFELLNYNHSDRLNDKNGSDIAAKQDNSRQTFIFSATLSMVHEPPKRTGTKKQKSLAPLTSKDKLDKIMDLVGLKSKPKVIDLSKKTGTAENLFETKIHCKLNEKDYYLYYFFVVHPGKTIVFCNSIDCVRRLVKVLSHLSCNVLPLHSDMHQKQRLKNLERFTSNSEQNDYILISTDVSARGLDIPNIKHVIHYQMPKTFESYVHRSGRTARATKEGLTVILLEPNEISFYRKLMKTLERVHELKDFPVDKKFLTSAIKERVDLAREIDKIEHSVRKRVVENNWYTRMADEMEIDLDEDLLNDMGDSYDQAKLRRTMESKQKQLGLLLSRKIHLPTNPFSLLSLRGGATSLQSESAAAFSFKYPVHQGIDPLKLENDFDRKTTDALEMVKQDKSKLKVIKVVARKANSVKKAKDAKKDKFKRTKR